MTDAFETEQGPSWQRPNWPVSELDDINLGLDPTEAVIERVAKGAKAQAVAARSYALFTIRPLLKIRNILPSVR